jgi:hypothetical protein
MFSQRIERIDLANNGSQLFSIKLKALGDMIDVSYKYYWFTSRPPAQSNARKIMSFTTKQICERCIINTIRCLV